jgi:hypothetical protein
MIYDRALCLARTNQTNTVNFFSSNVGEYPEKILISLMSERLP